MTFRQSAAALLLTLCSALATAEEAPQPLRVFCWNIHHGVGTDGKLDLERIAAVIRAQNPDIVALQEVDRNCHRSASTDQATVLAGLTGLKSVFGEAMPYDGGSYGQAILSKHPIATTRVIPLSAGEGREPRIAFEARIQHPAGDFTMVSVHLDHKVPDIRLSEGAVLLKALEATPAPIILAGDFNDTPTSPVLGLFAAPWLRVETTANSFPSAGPRKIIDHILHRGLSGPSAGAVVDEPVASDHRPITATFTFPSP